MPRKCYIAAKLETLSHTQILIAFWGIWVLGRGFPRGWSKMFVFSVSPKQQKPSSLSTKDLREILHMVVVLKLNHLFNFFEAFNLVSACIHNEKDIKVMKFCNISEASVLYSSKIVRCGSMIYFHACCLFSPLMHHHHQFFFPRGF